MENGNYERILNKISESAGIDKTEVERKIEAKKAKLAGLISKEGAAQIIAAELGINFDNEKLKINEILPGMRKVNVVGKIVSLFPIRSYTNKQGVESKVANFILADETSNIKCVLWDTNHIDLIEKGQIKEESVIEINNGNSRAEEIHLGSFSELKPSSETIENEIRERVINEKNIFDLKKGDTAKIRAFIVQSFAPKFFHVCPECKKKANSGADGSEYECAEHGKISPEKRALLNVVLDDGTETIRAVLFNEAIDKFGINIEETFESIKNNILGKEKIFVGNIRNNDYFNQPEMIVNDIKEIDLDLLINQLEK